MGIRYFLAREDNQTLFEILPALYDTFMKLGVGGAQRRGWLPRTIPTDGSLIGLIATTIGGLGLGVEYATWLASEISTFADGHPVLVLNDVSDFDRDNNDELRVVGSAYPSRGTK